MKILNTLIILTTVSILSTVAQAGVVCNQENVGKIKCQPVHTNSGELVGYVTQCERSSYPVSPVRYIWVFKNTRCQLP